MELMSTGEQDLSDGMLPPSLVDAIHQLRTALREADPTWVSVQVTFNHLRQRNALEDYITVHALFEPVPKENPRDEYPVERV